MYIGQTQNLHRRSRNHRCNTKGKNQVFQEWKNSLRETGDIPKMVVLKKCSSREECTRIESLLIKKMQPELNIIGK